MFLRRTVEEESKSSVGWGFIVMRTARRLLVEPLEVVGDTGCGIEGVGIRSIESWPSIAKAYPRLGAKDRRNIWRLRSEV